MSEVEDAVAVAHEGLNPVREDVVGEVVFAARWKRLMAGRTRWSTPSDEAPVLREVLGHLGEPDQRDATVAATFVQWLGTNLGSSLLHRAERIRELPWAERNGIGPHMLAWAECNVRKTHVDGGMRAIESILTPHDTPRGRLDRPLRVAELTLRDLEVVERVAQWLDTEGGARFLGGAIRELEERHDAEIERRRALRRA